MSDKTLARRARIQVFFGGTDITDSLEKYLLSLTFTDNEEDTADDLQIKLQDRSLIWLQKWLNQIVDAAAENDSNEAVSEVEEETKVTYKVIATSGLNVHSRAGDQYYKYGSLAYGTIIEVKEISGGWANITYGGKNAYVNASYLEAIYSTKTTASSSSSSSSSSGGGWNIGDTVTVTGTPQYTSYGDGTPGKSVVNYEGSITYLNLKSGVPYPIHVGYLGWFAESEVTKQGAEVGDMVAEGDADKGLKIQATIWRENWKSDGKDEKLECGQFELDGVVAQGPPSTVTIKATSMPYVSTIRQTVKNKAWENYKLSEIAGEISGNGGMTCMYLATSDPSYERVEQFKSTDIAFLKKLCQDKGLSLKITNNIIVIFDQADYESKPEVRTVRYGKEGGYISYKLSTEALDRYTSCRVSYVNSAGKLIEGIAYVDDYDADSDNNQRLEVTQKVSSELEAKELAAKLLRLHNKYEFTASFVFPGDPTLLAGCTVKLKDFGAWDGKYIIKQAKHSVSKSGYTASVSLRKALNQSSSSSSSSSGDSSDSSPSSSSELDTLARQVIRGEWGNGSERRRRLTEAGHDYDAVQARVNEILGIR